MISAVGVVVPARNEELLLPACLDSIHGAIGSVAPMRVVVVVALDSCRDGSAQVAAQRPWVSTVRTDASNVGLARRLGTEEVLRQLADVPLDEVWLAQTDADSTVPRDWLVGQIALADEGWDVVVGTVAVADWSEHHPSVRTRWAADYEAYEHHSHVHGANLGLTAASYVAVGGWPALQAHEDVALIRSLAERRVVATATLPVMTSARRDARASGGFGDTLNDLAG